MVTQAYQGSSRLAADDFYKREAIIGEMISVNAMVFFRKNESLGRIKGAE